VNETRTRFRFSGKWFTIVFTVVLIAGTAVGVLTAFRFQAMMSAFDDLRLQWPAAADDIDRRLSLVEDTLLRTDWAATDSGREAIDEWRSVRNAFLESSLYEKQAPLLLPLSEASRKLIGKASMASIDLPTLVNQTPTGNMGVASFLQADEILKELESDWIGKLSQFLFRIKLGNRISNEVFQGSLLL
jgi:hypothetical protein